VYRSVNSAKKLKYSF